MVAQVTGTLADVYTWENLYLAWRKAARGKRRGRAAAGFEYRLDTYRKGLLPARVRVTGRVGAGPRCI